MSPLTKHLGSLFYIMLQIMGIVTMRYESHGHGIVSESKWVLKLRDYITLLTLLSFLSFFILFIYFVFLFFAANHETWVTQTVPSS